MLLASSLLSLFCSLSHPLAHLSIPHSGCVFLTEPRSFSYRIQCTTVVRIYVPHFRLEIREKSQPSRVGLRHLRRLHHLGVLGGDRVQPRRLRRLRHQTGGELRGLLFHPGKLPMLSCNSFPHADSFLARQLAHLLSGVLGGAGVGRGPPRGRVDGTGPGMADE